MAVDDKGLRLTSKSLKRKANIVFFSHKDPACVILHTELTEKHFLTQISTVFLYTRDAADVEMLCKSAK